MMDGRMGGAAPPDRECSVVGELLVPFLDGETTGAEKDLVETHLERCPGCRRDLELHAEIGAALVAGTRAPSPRPTDGLFLDRVRKRLGQDARRGWRVALLAAAAALLVGAGLYLLVPFSREPVEGPLAVVEEAADEDLLANLEILEAFHEEGMEPTSDLVSILLGEDDDEDEGDISPEIFEYLLEEELENL